jgi:hypothetical protein
MTVENNGLHILNREVTATDNKTIIAMGAARGGTSMLSGILVKLGIHMGDARPPKYGDEYFSGLLSKFKIKEIKQLIKQRNEEHAVWGLKYPSILSLLLGQFLRQPVYIIVFRDIVAIAKRRAISNNKKILLEMLYALGSYFSFVIFMIFTRRPVLIVSYEKALLEPMNLVSGIADFLGISMEDDNIKRVAEFIKPSPEDYSCRERFMGDWNGSVDIISETVVSGWVANMSNKGQQITVELLINKKPLSKTIANLERKDVNKELPNVDVNCGFSFEIPELNKPQQDDIVEVRVFGENVFLKSSSRKIKIAG